MTRFNKQSPYDRDQKISIDLGAIEDAVYRILNKEFGWSTGQGELTEPFKEKIADGVVLEILKQLAVLK